MFATELFIVLFSVCSLTNAFVIETDDASHLVRSKRQTALKKLCSAELYMAPLKDACALPKDFALEPLVKKQLTAMKRPKLEKADSICVFCNIFFEKKWVDSAGKLLDKKIIADMNTAVASDAEWKKLIPNVVNKCIKEANSVGAPKTLKSGYKTSCKPAPYIFQTCLMVSSIKNCPAKHRKADYDDLKSLLLGCDYMAVAKTTKETAQGALSGLVNLASDGSLKKTFNKAKSNKNKIKDAIPSDIMGDLEKLVPKDTNFDKLNADDVVKSVSGSKDPMELAKNFKIDTSALDAFGK